MISISTLERLEGCPGSAALPRANTTSQYAQMGVDGHAAIEEGVAAGSLASIPEAIAGYIDDGDVVAAEVSVAYDWRRDTARVLGVGKGRDYSDVRIGELPGTADLVRIRGDWMLVADWKLFADVGAPDRNIQVLTYALALARVYKPTRITLAIAYLGTGRHRIVEIDTFELEAVAHRVRVIMSNLPAPGAMPSVNEGPWCKHCPSAHSCPAKVALIRRLVSGQEADELELLLPLDEEAAAIAHERLGHAEQLLKRIKGAIYARAAESPIRLRNGRMLGMITTEGNERLDGNTVHSVIAEALGDECAERATKRTATKKDIEAAIKYAGRPLAATMRTILDGVRARGGASRKVSTEIKEYDPASLVEAVPGK